METRTLLLAGLVLATALSGCLSNEGGLKHWEYEPPASPPGSEPQPEPEPSPELENTEAPPVENLTRPGIRFVALGDQGTGKEGQYAVAAAIEAVCAERGCDFAVALGDNIYESGVEDEYDPQFDLKFEQPYANLTMPFYLALGNHDNSCDPVSCGTFDTGAGQWYSAGNHEVAYHYRTDRASDKWNMPARFYDFQAGDTATFLALDTNTLMFYGLSTPDPTEAFQKQEAWIDEAVAGAETPWKIAFGHHPYVSNGQHGNAGRYDSAEAPVDHPVGGAYVKQFFDEHVCDKVDLILSGHDHDLQWLPAPECGKTEQVVSGAAGKTRALADPERNEAHFQQGDTLGFWWFEIVGDELVGVLYDGDGNVLFERGHQRVV